MGLRNTVTVMQNAVMGLRNKVTVMQNAIMGLQNTVPVMQNAVMGLKTTVTVMQNAVIGLRNTVTVMQSAVMGLQNTVMQRPYFRYENMAAGSPTVKCHSLMTWINGRDTSYLTPTQSVTKIIIGCVGVMFV